MEYFCNNCNETKDYSIRINKITNFRGYKIDAFENIAVCKTCNSDILVPDIENDNLKRLYDEYRTKADVISPNEIINFRTKYNLSQRELVAILNWGKMTINRYEKGSLPDESHNFILKNITKDVKSFLGKAEIALRNNKITEKTFNKLKENIPIDIKRNQIIERLEQTENIYNGFRKFDLERTENLIGYLASEVNNLYMTSLNKYLWFIDLLGFKDNTRSILGIPYIRYTHGPVIADFTYYDIVRLNTDQFYVEEKEVNDKTLVRIKSLNNYNLSIFKGEELNVINKVISKFKNLKCADISKISHDEDGWIETKSNNLISYNYAMNLKYIS